MKRYLRWIVAAEFLFAAGNLHAVEVFALIQTEEALNRRQINQALLSTGDLAHDEF